MTQNSITNDVIGITKTISVEFDDSAYPIFIGEGLLARLPSLLAEKTNSRQVLIVADAYFENTALHEIVCGLESVGFSVFTFLMDAGKGNKNINEVMKIYGLMEENNFPRDATLIALGGGVVGDLAGFVASTWLRGMNLVHIPTSLMAMVDSSVGGKVAINFRRTINAIGNYYHPILNLIDLRFVKSLPDRDYYSGIAEVIKCGLIADSTFCQFLIDRHQAIVDRNAEDIVHFIGRTLEIKIDHVKGDTREGGKRLLLNYGHTLGHSIEISTERGSKELYRHGEGVSIGTMAVAYIAERFLGLEQGLYGKIRQLFELYDLPVEVDTKKHGLDRDKLLLACKQNVKKDKKRKDNVLRLILVNSIGQAQVYSDVPFSLVEDAFEHIVQ